MSSQFARLRGALDRVGTTTPGTIVGVFAEDLTAIMNHYVEVVKEAAELKAARAQPAQAGQVLTEGVIDDLLPTPDGTAEANVERIEISTGVYGTEYDEVPAWSKPLVIQAIRAAQRYYEHKSAQPDQAGQVLTDEEIDAVYIACRIGGVQDFARAIEQAVLAKRVPMTDDTELIRQLAAALDRCRFDSLNMSVADMRALSEARTAASKRLCIVGEKGGA